MLSAKHILAIFLLLMLTFPFLDTHIHESFAFQMFIFDANFMFIC